MNKRILKNFLIIVGLILLGINFIIHLIDSGDIFEALLYMAFETFVEFGELESILSILGITLLAFGILIKNENTSNEPQNDEKSVRKYKLLRILGYTPFIVILCFVTIRYGFNDFLGIIFLFSLFGWPLYIIGIILIIKSSSKVRSFKELNNKNITNQNEQQAIKKNNFTPLIAIVAILCIAIVLFINKYLIF